MQFKETELTQQVAQTVRNFAEQHIRPNVMVWDEAQEFPLSCLKNWVNWE